MKNLLIIEGDTYFIGERLKEIDKDYFVVFNLIRNKYEVHVKGQAGNSYAFTVPYPNLDERTINFALKTRSQNRDKIIEEIEKDNEKSFNRYVQKQVSLIKEII